MGSAYNPRCFRRLSIENNSKVAQELEHEEADSMALWLSLSGARCVIVQRWSLSFFALERCFSVLTSELTSGKV
jgi:hypothetical protein